MRDTKCACQSICTVPKSGILSQQLIAATLIYVLLFASAITPALAQQNQSDPALQDQRKQIILERIDYVITHLNGYEFSRNGWLRLGSLGNFRQRLMQADVQIFVDPGYCGNAEALYETGNPLTSYDNDLILRFDPAIFENTIQNEGPSAFVLWHEVIHIISHGHQENLLNPSIPFSAWSSSMSGAEEGKLDHYFIEWAENMVMVGVPSLRTFEEMLVKLDKDRQPNAQSLRSTQTRWKSFLTGCNERLDAKQYAINEVPDSSERLEFEQMMGLHVDEDAVIKGYLAKGYRSEPFGLVATFKEQPAKISTPQEIEFDASDSTGAYYWDGSKCNQPGIERYYWVFDADGANPTVIETIEPITSHYYDAFGSYRVVLFVADEYNHVSSKFEKQITVEGLKIQLNGSPTTGPAPLSVSFRCKVLSASNPKSLLFLWDFDGDGLFDETSNGESDFRGMDSASAKYKTAGTYTATVEAIDSLGNSDKASLTITVEDGVGGVLTATPISGPPPLTVNFSTAGSKSGAGLLTGYEWDFDGNGLFNEAHNGEAAARHQSSVSHLYVKAGTYTATVRMTDDQNNVGLAKTTVTVESGLVAAFTIAPASGVSPLVAIFDATSSTTPKGETITYLWDFDSAGKGQPYASVGNILTLNYPDDGVYKVTLKLRDSQGNESAETSQTLTVGMVGTPPVAAIKIIDISKGGSFDANSAKGMIPLRVKFSAADSTDADGQVVKYIWHFDDWTTPLTTTTPEIWHEYNITSQFSPTVIVSDDFGNDSANMPRVTVNVGVAEPQLSVSQSPAVGGGTLASCTLLGTYIDDQTVLSGCSWDFGDSTALVSTTGGNASHVYSTPGLYVISIQVSYSTNAGGTATVKFQHAVEIGGQLVAKLTMHSANGGAAPNPIPVGMPMLVSADGSTSPFGAIAKYEFDLDGNGSFEHNNKTTPTLSHSFTQAGSVTLAVRITDDKGNTATQKYTISVGAQLKAVLSATPDSGPPPLAVQLSAAGSTGALAITGHEWDLDGDSVFESDTGAVATSTVTFNNPGLYTVSLRVTDESGQSAVQSTSVTVEEGNTLSGFLDVASYDTQNQYGYKGNGDGVAPLQCKFAGYAKSSIGIPIAKFEIDYTGNGSFTSPRGWGEGGSGRQWDSRAEIRDYTYTTPGIYLAALRITDQAGNLGIATRIIIVDPNALSLTLNANPANGPAQLRTTLTAVAQSPVGGSLAYEWDLDGDGNYEHSASSSLEQIFDQPGSYSIGVRVTDGAGNSAINWCVVSVETAGLTADFRVTPTEGTPPLDVVCDASSSVGEISAYIWEIRSLGNTIRSYETATPETRESFSQVGEYEISLTLRDKDGNLSPTATKQVLVKGGCSEDQIWSVFPSAQEVGCEGLESFDAHSTLPEYGITNYQLSWGEPRGGVPGRWLAVRLMIYDSIERCDNSWNNIRSNSVDVSSVNIGDKGMRCTYLDVPQGIVVLGNVMVTYSLLTGVAPATYGESLAGDSRIYQAPDFNILAAMLARLQGLGCDPVL